MLHIMWWGPHSLRWIFAVVLNTEMKASKTSSQQRNTTELPRITFRPDDIRLSMGKSDPMMAGVDMDALRPVIRRIEQMKERIELPGTYSVHNEFQLFSERCNLYLDTLLLKLRI